MAQEFEPVQRRSLTDDVAQRINQLIQEGRYLPGSRLPAINHMAREFSVGAPTLREALKKLETVGAVDIRHGSGVYVGRSPNTMLIGNPIFGGVPSKKSLVDLIEARIPIEAHSAALAATNGSDAQFTEMRRVLDEARANLDNLNVLSEINMTFHRHIALASGNTVIHQLLDALATIFSHEQRVILDVQGHREDDYTEHCRIYEAVSAHNVDLATQRMRTHLEGVRTVLLRWDGTPVAPL